MILIGLEVHSQLNTKTKLFCSCKNVVDTTMPNIYTCPTCLGLPGARPSLNKEAVRKALQVSLALNMKITKKMFFSRKSYFYPDMTKNFQITQYELPVSEKGHLLVKVKDKKIKVNMRRIHIEEDPGKLIHIGGDITHSEYTLIDYNRSGTPLIEIVTEPDMHDPYEARIFVETLRNILEHLNVLNPDMVLKVDVNVSIDGGERVEIKNITGAKNVERALRFEINRLKSIKSMGVKLKSHTRHFNEKSGVTSLLRTKETEEGYGYIFEPDLPWYNLSSEVIKKERDTLPELPYQRIKRFVREYKLSLSDSESLILVDKNIADIFEKIAQKNKDYKKISSFLLVQLMKILNYNKVRLNQTKINADNILKLLNSVNKGIISERTMKEFVKTAEFLEGEDIDQIIRKLGYQKIVDDKEIKKKIIKVLSINKKQVKKYHDGNKKIFDYLLGECLKEMDYKIDVKFLRKHLLSCLKN